MGHFIKLMTALVFNNSTIIRFTVTQPIGTSIEATKSLLPFNHSLRRFERMGTRLDDDYKYD